MSSNERDDDGFLIGALTAIVHDELLKRAQEGYAAAGFPDLRPSHGPVFAYLPPEGCRVTELAERARVTKQAMGYLVDYLEEHGYVERVPDPTDRRAQLVRRTERGWEFNRAARRLVQEIQDEWATLIGEEQMRQLLRILRQLARVLGVEYAGSAPEVGSRPQRS